MSRSISIAMIVRNESAQLRDCLACVRDIAGEVCVVDTGSTDNTVALARAAGAKVSHFPWCDDFSAARNVSLDACTGDWIFVLDADERIDRVDAGVFRGLADGPPGRCYSFETRNYTDDPGIANLHACGPRDLHGHGFFGWFPGSKVRFFPKRADVYFEGKVHELVEPSATRAGLCIEPCPIAIHHYPLSKSPERLREKRALYVRLGQGKVEAAPDDPTGYAELGNQYAELGDYAAAAAAYRDCLIRDPENAVVLKDLGAALFVLGRKEDAGKALRLAVALDPSLPDGWRNLGVLCADGRDWDEALACFQRAVDLRPGWSEGLRHLGVALDECGRLEEAAAMSQRALEANPASAECLSLYVKQLTELGRAVRGREVLAALIRANGPTPALENALGELYKADGLARGETP